MYKKQLCFLKEFSWICVVQILEEFNNIFGPELIGVTGDPKRIDEVLCRVESLVLPIEDVDFNPFNICKMSSWKMIIQDFDTTVQVGLGHLECGNCDFWTNSYVLKIAHFFCVPYLIHVLHVSAQAIEGEAINFIDQSFKTLRSSAAAFDMLLKFKHIRSREAINKHLMGKFNDILAQYCKEVLYCEIKKKC